MNGRVWVGEWPGIELYSWLTDYAEKSRGVTGDQRSVMGNVAIFGRRGATYS